MAGDMPPGCVFAPRCAYAEETCGRLPRLEEIARTHRLRCWYPLEVK
jgi:peptide/nickel transport system ATP-binding protein